MAKATGVHASGNRGAKRPSRSSKRSKVADPPEAFVDALADALRDILRDERRARAA